MPRPDPEFLAEVLDALSGIVYVYDLERQVNVFVTHRWVQEFGYTPQETQATDAPLLARIVHPDDMAAVMAHHRALASATTDAPRTVAYRVFRKDGSTCWLSSVDRPLKRNETGRVKLIVGHAQELTPQEIAETLQAESEARFRSIVENLPDAVFIANANAEILQVNDAACVQLGYTREEFLHLRIDDLVPPDFRARVRQRLSASPGTATARESVHVRKDGKQIPVETVVLGIEIEGKPAYLGVARDISDRQRLESQLRDAQRMEAVGRLAGAVAHDFNNILAVILGGASLLEQSPTLTQRDKVMAASVVNAATRGADLTRQLLTFGRKQSITMEPLDLGMRVESTLSVLRRLLHPSITIETDLSSNCRVVADPTMMDQVVMNLTLNARDAMPKGGTLKIRVAPEANHPHAIELTVTDTGSGIDEEDLPHIFEPFFTTKSNEEGSGIGLATVYGIVAQHNGHITVSSTKGEGTTFCVSLPQTSAAIPIPTTQAVAVGDTRVLGILLVEDMAPVRAMMVHLLESAGHRVFEATSADEACAIWNDRSGEIDLLLSDVGLGSGRSGRELAAELRERRSDLAVILMSGFDHEEDRIAGHYDVLQKPFRMNQLNALLLRRFGNLGGLR